MYKSTGDKMQMKKRWVRLNNGEIEVARAAQSDSDGELEKVEKSRP